jgi:hypothetical protein
MRLHFHSKRFLFDRKRRGDEAETSGLEEAFVAPRSESHFETTSTRIDGAGKTTAPMRALHDTGAGQFNQRDLKDC